MSRTLEVVAYGRGSAHEVAGTLTVADDGKIATTGRAARWVSEFPKLPTMTGPVTPADGERYLEALRATFRTPYLLARWVPDGAVKDLSATLPKYSADQPRDDHGKWTSDGSGDASGQQLASGVHPEGFTIHPYRGSAPKTGYQVALTGHTEKHPEAVLNDEQQLAQILLNHRVNNAEVYKRGGNVYVGGWVHEGSLWIEPSEHFESREQAIQAGVDRNQISIWDNAKGEEIATGGTGQPLTEPGEA